LSDYQLMVSIHSLEAKRGQNFDVLQITASSKRVFHSLLSMNF
jgi:hypothetical protein